MVRGKRSFSYILLMSIIWNFSWSQEERLIYAGMGEEEEIKQFVMINDQSALALTKGGGQFKLLNTVLLIQEEKVTDRYVNRSSVDYINILNDSVFTVFQPTAGLLYFKVKNHKLELIKKEKISFFKTVWSTSFREGVLNGYKDVSVYFDQGSEDRSLNPFDGNSTPAYYVYHDDKKKEINPFTLKGKYKHWPSYGEHVMPPMTYIRLIGKDIYFALSNQGRAYAFNTESGETRVEEFRPYEGVVSWSLFYDHILKRTYYVSFLGNDTYEFFDNNTATRGMKRVKITGFVDSIVNGMALTKRKSQGKWSYFLKNIEL